MITCTDTDAGVPCGRPALALLMIVAPGGITPEARIALCITHLLPVLLRGGLSADAIARIMATLGEDLVQRLVTEVRNERENTCDTSENDAASSAGSPPTPSNHAPSGDAPDSPGRTSR